MTDDDREVELPDPKRPTPPRLYKYRAFGNDIAKGHLRSILVDHNLHFSTRTKFNDPFDCLVPSFQDVRIRKMVRFMEARFQTARFGMRREEARTGARRINLDKLRSDTQEAVNEAGIFSLAEDPCDMLMWGHYADSHRGVCLEFSVTDEDPFGLAQPVVYSTAPPKFDPCETEEKNTEAAVLTKSVQWLYEREWRIINHDIGSGDFPFPPEKLTAVILGYQMETAVRTEVLNMVAHGGLNVSLFEALPSKREYKMRLEPIFTL